MVERIARTREALIEAAARCLSSYGYSNLIFEQIASEAGCTRDELYDHFTDKEDLARAVLAWVNDVWEREVSMETETEFDPCVALIDLARAHAVFSRRDTARVVMALRMEFNDRNHPLGRELEDFDAGQLERCERLIIAGRNMGSIPPGPPVKTMALACLGVVEGAVIKLAGNEPYDEFLVARAIIGVLGLGESQSESASLFY